MIRRFNGKDLFEDLFITREAKFKASNYFKRVVEGQPEIYRTPLFQERDPHEICERWFNKARSGFRIVPGLLDFETEMLGKVGPLSVMKPLLERIDDVKHYYTMIEQPGEPIDSSAINAFIMTLKSNNVAVKLQDARTTLQNMRLSTNSGVPYFSRRRDVIEETLRIIDDRDYYVAILGWRGQEGGPEIDDIKQRVVWMFPLATNILELEFYQPAIAEWQKRNINSAYISMRAVEEKITKCFDTKGNDYVIVTDFSKFDQHFNVHLQAAAEEVIRSMSKGFGFYNWLEEVFNIKYSIPILLDKDYGFSGKHGMGSGSGGTNFDECCAHSCLQWEAAIKAGQVLNPFSNAYGDDGYLTYPGIDIDHIIDVYTSHGQEMNVDKQHVSKHSAVYLRRYFHDAYRDNKGIMLGIYSTCRALGRIMYQERYYRWEDEVDYARYVTLRAWSILENCNNHPLFDELVKYVIEGDRYRLGLDIPGFMEGFQSDFDKLQLLDPDVLGYTKTLQSETTSIKDWRIYKLLNSMR